MGNLDRIALCLAPVEAGFASVEKWLHCQGDGKVKQYMRKEREVTVPVEAGFASVEK